MTIITKQGLISNAEMREIAIANVPLNVGDGEKADYLNAVMEEYLKLQYYYFPLMCEDTRIANKIHEKELDDHGYKTSTRMVGGKVVEGTSGWSKDKKFKEKWIISTQLRYFMCHVDKQFFDDKNSRVRNSFMKGVIRGDDPYSLLRKVYGYYGSNVKEAIEEITLN